MQLLFSESDDQFKQYTELGLYIPNLTNYKSISDTFTDQTAISFIEQVRAKFERPVTFDEVMMEFETFNKESK